MADEKDGTTGKKPWPRPQVIEVGQVDEQTTAGVGNLGDQTGTDRWKPTAVNQESATLPEGE